MCIYKSLYNYTQVGYVLSLPSSLVHMHAPTLQEKKMKGEKRKGERERGRQGEKKREEGGREKEGGNERRKKCPCVAKIKIKIP